MHVVDSVAPVEVEYVPAAHIVQSENWSWRAAIAAESVRYVPAEQAVQAVETVAPVEVEYLPARQIVQSNSSSCKSALVALSAK